MRPYHFGSVIAEEFRPSAGYVLQRARPGNPFRGESRTKLNAVMVENLPRHRRRQRAGEKADGLAPKSRGWDFFKVPEDQGKPLASTKKQKRAVEVNPEYQTYLLSEEWRRKRLQRLAIAQNRCSACSNAKAVHVHHLTYSRIFKEEMADLLPLCDFHHSAAEDLIKRGKLFRTGDVLFLAAETLRLIVPLSPSKANPTIPKPLREKLVVGRAEIEYRNEVQRNLLGDSRFTDALLACYDRRSIKVWLHAFGNGSSRSQRSKIINNGIILFDRYKRGRRKK